MIIEKDGLLLPYFKVGKMLIAAATATVRHGTRILIT